MGPVRFFVPYKRRKRDGIMDDQLHKKMSQSKSSRLTLCPSTGVKTDDATGMSSIDGHIFIFIVLSSLINR